MSNDDARKVIKTYKKIQNCQKKIESYLENRELDCSDNDLLEFSFEMLDAVIETKQYKKSLINLKDSKDHLFNGDITEENNAMYEFYRGKVHFLLENYIVARDILELLYDNFIKFVGKKNEKSLEIEYYLIISYYHSKENILFKEYIDELISKYIKRCKNHKEEKDKLFELYYYRCLNNHTLKEYKKTIININNLLPQYEKKYSKDNKKYIILQKKLCYSYIIENNYNNAFETFEKYIKYHSKHYGIDKTLSVYEKIINHARHKHNLKYEQKFTEMYLELYKKQKDGNISKKYLEYEYVLTILLEYNQEYKRVWIMYKLMIDRYIKIISPNDKTIMRMKYYIIHYEVVYNNNILNINKTYCKDLIDYYLNQYDNENINILFLEYILYVNKLNGYINESGHINKPEYIYEPVYIEVLEKIKMIKSILEKKYYYNEILLDINFIIEKVNFIDNIDINITYCMNSLM